MRIPARLVPDTLGGRVMIVLFVGLIVFHLGSLWLHQISTEATLGSTREEELAERLAAAKRSVAAVPPPERDRLAHALSSASLDLHWTPAPTVGGGGAGSPRIDAVRARLHELVPDLGTEGLRLGYAAGDNGGMPHALLGALPLPDGTWLNFSAALFRPAAPEHATLTSTTAMAVGVLLLGLIVVRWIGQPLRALSDAADKIGQPGGAARMPEEGPYEVRHAAQAFNQMQSRIERLIADRTQALAAVSHDLRTPIARLRLRAGFVEDAEAARAIDADLDEMEAMIDATLAYLRGDAEAEEQRPADLVTILGTLCDAATDAGGEVTLRAPPQARLKCRPLTLKRAFANLIDNAVKYGGGARVVVEDDGALLTVRIEDDGPGIPEDQFEAVFEPFRRLEASRNRGTGGSGLGLTIARRAVEQQGGSLTLDNRPAGGLVATVRLPRPQT